MTTQTQPAAAVPTRALLGRKLGMTQVWDEDGKVVPITVVQVDKNVVTQVRDQETDGYTAIQIGFGQIDQRKVTKPLAGHFNKAGVSPRRHLVEVRTGGDDEFTLGQELAADIFEVGQKVDVTGKTKGKGFAGVMKRHGFAGVSASMVLTVTTVNLVLSALAPPPDAYSKAYAWPDAWVGIAVPSKILKFRQSMPKKALSWLPGLFPAPRAALS